MPGDSYSWENDERFVRDGYLGRRGDLNVLPRSPAEALEPDHPPEAPRSRKRQHQRHGPFLAVLNTVFTALFLGLIGLAGLFYYAKAEFDGPGPLTHSTVVTIPKGEGVNAIASRLEREGIISDRRLFVAATFYFGAQAKLKAGDYAIEARASMRDVLDTLVEGRAILYSVTIPEGFTSQQVVERLKEHPELSGEITEVPPEGSLLPETYRFARNTDRMDLIRRMQDAQKRFLDKVWESRAKDLPISTKEEAVILASIVEKETGRADERARVAAVFLNRLRRGMKLASDPTIIYGLVGGRGSLGRPILQSELDKQTPYNTYLIKGLPPTPIANPGRAAIEAVLRPSDTKDLYFVADGTGGHVFAASLAEHRKNVARWREIEKEIRRREAEQAAKEKEAAAATELTDIALIDVDSAVSPAASQPPGGARIDIPLPVRRPQP